MEETTIKRVCPVCGEPAKIQFTKGKGRPYIACDEHRIQALLLEVYEPRKPWWKRIFG